MKARSYFFYNSRKRPQNSILAQEEVTLGKSVGNVSSQTVLLNVRDSGKNIKRKKLVVLEMPKFIRLLLIVIIMAKISFADELAGRLKSHVVALSADIGERSIFHPAKLAAAGNYVADQFRKAGYDVEILPYKINGRIFKNIQAVKNGSSEIIIIGAHYDTVATTPGADDNGSGVAVLLELARLAAKRNFTKTVRFVAFSTEEPPVFQTKDMGSFRYAQDAKNAGEKIVGMVSLEMVGFYSDVLGSQQYPFLYGLFYPPKGNFVGVVSDFGSREWKTTVAAALAKHAKLPVESAWGPRFITGISWSDQWSFWKHGFPAVMFTDTGPYRNPHYHLPTDTPETLDYNRMAALTRGLAGMLEELA